MPLLFERFFRNGRSEWVITDRAIDLRIPPAKAKPEKFSIPDSRRVHVLTIGGSGSGKSRLLMDDIRRAIEIGWDLIVIDPKGETDRSALFPVMFEAAWKAGRLEDLAYTDLADPEVSFKFNPFSHYFRLEEIADMIVAMIPVGKEPFFRNQAYKVCKFAVFAYDYLKRREGKNPVFTISALQELTSYDWISRQVEIFTREAMLDPRGREIAILGKSVADLEPRDFERTVSSLSNVMAQIGVGSVREIIDVPENPIFTRLWEGKGIILYVFTASMILPEASRMISKLLLCWLLTTGGKIYRRDEGRLRRRLLVVVDEAARAVFPEVINLVDKARGAGMFLHFASQSVANYDVELGSAAKRNELLANFGVQIFLNCGDEECTGRYVAGRAGTLVLPEVIKGSGGLGADGVVREKEVHVIDPGAITRLEPPDQERHLGGQFIAFTPARDGRMKVLTGRVKQVPSAGVRIRGMKTVRV